MPPAYQKPCITKSWSVGSTSPAEPTAARSIRPAGVYSVALFRGDVPTNQGQGLSVRHAQKPPLTVIGAGGSKTKRRHRCDRQHAVAGIMGIESPAVAQAQIIGGTDMH